MAKRSEEHVILEFFSGIGGMRYAAEAWADLASDRAGLRAVRVAASFEISEVCNRVYNHNFGDKPRTKSIEHLDPALLDSFGADTWLMSPPCQPYTSMGKQRDAQDPRARALLHLCDVIPKLSAPPMYILLENVNHFQHSQSHKMWLEAMNTAGFVCHEFLFVAGADRNPKRTAALLLSCTPDGPWRGRIVGRRFFVRSPCVCLSCRHVCVCAQVCVCVCVCVWVGVAYAQRKGLECE
jgi:site-specific DNA-cytosine methylase